MCVHFLMLYKIFKVRFNVKSSQKLLTAVAKYFLILQKMPTNEFDSRVVQKIKNVKLKHLKKL